jgi:hypothetical protein
MVDVSTVRISEAPGGKCRLLEVPICECAMRGSLALHYARLTSAHTNQAPLSTVIVSKQGSSRCRRDIAFSRAHLAKNAMGAIPPPHPTQLTSSGTKQASLSTVSMSKQGVFEAPE